MYHVFKFIHVYNVYILGISTYNTLYYTVLAAYVNFSIFKDQTKSFDFFFFFTKISHNLPKVKK